MANCIAWLFPSMAWRGPAKEPSAGHSGQVPVLAVRRALVARDAEALLRSVAGRLLLPVLQARAQAALARVGLAHRVGEDAVGVDLEGQVAPAGQHVTRRLREHLVDRLAAEVGGLLADERRRVQDRGLRWEVAGRRGELRALAGADPLQESRRRELVLARREHRVRAAAVLRVGARARGPLWD